MPDNTPEPGSAADWIRYARSDPAVAAGASGPEVLLETLCFHAQQAAEKALKTVLVARGVAIPFTHDLAHLVHLVRTSGAAWPDDLDEVVELTPYAVQARYPAWSGDVTDDEYIRAVSLARRAVTWATSVIEHACAEPQAGP